MKLTQFFIALLCSALMISAQDIKKYSNQGIAFEYLEGWKLTEKPGKDTDEISLSNADADAQITLIAVKKDFGSKDPAEVKKQIAEPWIASLMKMYATQNIYLQRTDVKTEAGGTTADGVKLGFLLDEQLGTIEAYWLLLDKKAVLVYMIRPDRTADKAAGGWDLVRKTLAAAGEK